MTNVPLRKWAIGGVLIVTLTIAVTSTITDTLELHGLGENVSTEDLSELKQLQETTSITQTAQERSESAEAKSEFFSLPGVINTLRTVFSSIPIWETFAGVFIETLGIANAAQNWPQILATSVLLILISYRFAKVIR